jgi:hypothetical protein
MNNSNRYNHFLSFREELESKLAEVKDYLEPGSAVTTINFYNARKKLVTSRVIRGSWTTSLGKSRVELNHKNFVNYHTSNPPAEGKSAKVISPFYPRGYTTNTVAYTAYRNLPIVFNT